MRAEATLREKARAAMLNGKLPRATPNRTFLAGAGTGVACAVCAELVTTDQAEIELQFTGEGVQPRLNRYQLHVWCFTAWKSERRYGGPSSTLPTMRLMTFWSLRWISSSWTAIWFGGSREQEATASAMMRVGDGERLRPLDGLRRLVDSAARLVRPSDKRHRGGGGLV